MTGRRRVVASILMVLLPLLVLISPAGAEQPPRGSVTQAVITDSLQVGNVVPMWGQQIPKLVYDGQWYYAVSLDGVLFDHPWNGKIFKSPDGVQWSVAAEFSNKAVYQPPGLVLDHMGNLHMLVGCYVSPEAPCFPGFTTDNQGAVDFHHVVFHERLADGSFDFGVYSDYSLLDTPNYYMGLAVDRTGHTLYAAYSVDNWDLHLAVFDTRTNTYTHRLIIGSPPAGRAWLYPIVQPGNVPGELYLLAGQFVLGAPNSAVYDRVIFMESQDSGLSWSDPITITEVENPDGFDRWVDRSDIAIGPSGDLHLLYFHKSDTDPDNWLWYQEGLGSTPVGLGQRDNHSQLWIAPSGERFIFTERGPNLVVLRSLNGVDWQEEVYPVLGPRNIFWSTLADRSTGSVTSGNQVTLMVAGQGPDGPAFSHLLMLQYRYLPGVVAGAE